MNNLAPSFLIGSSSFLQVSRTCMKAWMSSNFGKFASELRPLIDVRIWFLLNILKTYRPIKTKFCIHIIIDKIYVGIVNHCFSQRTRVEKAHIWPQILRKVKNLYCINIFLTIERQNASVQENMFKIIILHPVLPW